MLTYADVCRRMPTYADLCRRMLAVKNVEAPPTPVVSLPEVLDVDAEEEEEEGGGDAQSQQQSARELALQVGEEPNLPTNLRRLT